MIDKEQLFKRIDEDFELLQKRMIDYRNFVTDTISWWEANVNDREQSVFVGIYVNYKGVQCCCTGFSFMPQKFIFSITVRPMASHKDIGSGAGNQHTIEFK